MMWCSRRWWRLGMQHWTCAWSRPPDPTCHRSITLQSPRNTTFHHLSGPTCTRTLVNTCSSHPAPLPAQWWWWRSCSYPHPPRIRSWSTSEFSSPFDLSRMQWTLWLREMSPRNRLLPRNWTRGERRENPPHHCIPSTCFGKHAGRTEPGITS